MNLDKLERIRDEMGEEIRENAKLVNRDKAYGHLCVSFNELGLCIKFEEKRK